MKILWLYRYCKNYNFDHWFHIDFARCINAHPNIELMAYGEAMEVGCPDIAPIAYKRETTLDQIRKTFSFDTIIMNTKGRMFNYYTPRLHPSYNREVREGCFLPPDFNTYKVPKIMLEEDYHYEGDDTWYRDIGIGLMLQRHYSNFVKCKKQGNLNVQWYPFSVDTNIFTPNPRVRRKKKIGFAGSSTDKIYPHRRFICKKLGELGLLENFQSTQKEYDYITCLQSYISHLSCSSVYNITPAKMFEIMATGSLLFTNKTNKYGLNLLFKKDMYCTYDEDYSNLISQTRKIITEPEYVSNCTQKALAHINEHHTNAIRIRELYDIIGKEFNLK